MIFPRQLIALSSLVTLAFAAPLDVRGVLDVFSPPILSPNAATVWQSGAIETVTWYGSVSTHECRKIAYSVVKGR